MNPALETLLDAAILAPSGDNTQPWRFVVDEASRSIDVEVDETRDQSPMNAGQRMARIACGAAIENMVRTARHNHWPLTVEQGEGDSLARLTLANGIDEAGVIDDAIVRRHTNRNFYDGQPAENFPILGELQRESAADRENGIHTHWITDRSQLGEIARIVGEADAMMFGIRSMRQAFLENIRFDLPPDARAEEGLPLGSLGLNAFDRFGLKMLRYLPDPIVRYGGVLRSFRNRALKLLAGSSGVCIIAANGDSHHNDVAIGRAFERNWLTLTASGLAAQPMMSLPVLDGWLCSGSEPARLPKIGGRGRGLFRRMHDAARVISEHRIAAVIRFGYAQAPQSRAARQDKAKCVFVKRQRHVTADTPFAASHA